MIRFLGREGHVSDWFGEKLNEAHVSQLMSNAFEELAISPSFAMLACDTEQSSPSYVLYIDAIESDEVLKEAATKIEVGLQENFHYHYARHLGQLSKLRVLRAEEQPRHTWQPTSATGSAPETSSHSHSTSETAGLVCFKPNHFRQPRASRYSALVNFHWFIPLLQARQMLQRSLRMKMVDKMVANVMWRYEQFAEESEMMIARQTQNRFHAAILARLLLVLHKQSITSQITSNHEGQQVKFQ